MQLELAGAELVRLRKQRLKMPVSASRARDSNLLRTRRSVPYPISLPQVLSMGLGGNLKFPPFRQLR
jgi:hypothetical protein